MDTVKKLKVLCDSSNINAANLCKNEATLKIYAYTSGEIASTYYFCPICWRQEEKRFITEYHRVTVDVNPYL